MKIDLANKTILITGSSDGIGKMLAVELSKLGANIILLGRNQKKLNSVYDQLNTSTSLQKHLIIETDLNTLKNITAHEIFIAINQEFNDIDGLIHNAAILGTMTPLRDYDMSIWDQVIQTNLTAPFLLTKALLPMLATSSLPRIIFTSSGVANIGKSFWGAYSVSKFGLKGLAEIFADELESTSPIKVFNFDPGATRTNMRASAYPAEDPNKVKPTIELLNCYLWFFSKESIESNENYFEFSDLSKKANST